MKDIALALTTLVVEDEVESRSGGLSSNEIQESFSDANDARTEEVDLGDSRYPQQQFGVLTHPRGLEQQRVSFQSLQEWQGRVTEIREDAFVALLLDITKDSELEEEEAEVPFDGLADFEAKKLRLGSYFRWVVGYKMSGGTKELVSRIVVRDLPVVTPADVEEARDWARDVVASVFD